MLTATTAAQPGVPDIFIVICLGAVVVGGVAYLLGLLG